MKRIISFVTSFAVWVLLVWPFEMLPCGGRRVMGQDLIAGLIAALLVTLIMRDVTPRTFRLWMNPARYVWFVLYLIVLNYYIINANLDVSYLVVHPAMPINPGIVKVRSSLRNPAAIAMLANSITLTPGTLTINASEDGTFYVHCINIESLEEDALAYRISGRFEWFLKRIFE